MARQKLYNKMASKRRRVEDYIFTIDKDTYKCKVCDETLKSHEKIVIVDPMDKIFGWMCTICGTTFDKDNGIIRLGSFGTESGEA